MRKVCIGMLLMGTITLQAQIFKTVQVQRFAVSDATDVKVAGVSAKGTFVLTTTGSNRGLQKVNVATREVEQLSDAIGAGFEPAISSDEKNVMFREVTFTADSHMRMTALKNHSLTTHKQQEVKSPQREVKAYGFVGNKAFAQNEVQQNTDEPSKAKALNTEKTITSVYTEDLQLMLNKDGQTIQLSPNGTEESYIWPSISPDGTKILYYVSGEGAYVCDLEGKQVKFIHHDCRAPKWFDNNTIIAMNDTDNGEVVTSSQIVAYSLTGEKQELTSSTTFTMYPYVATEAGMVACSDIYGQIFLIKLTK